MIFISTATIKIASAFDFAIDPIKEIEIGQPLNDVEKSLAHELQSVISEGTDFKDYSVKIQEDSAILSLFWNYGDTLRNIRSITLHFTYKMEFHQYLRRGELIQSAQLLTGVKGKHIVIDTETKMEEWIYMYGIYQIVVRIYNDIHGFYMVILQKSKAD